MAHLWRGILVFLAGFSLLVVNATSPAELVKRNAEPGGQNEKHFHEVAVDQEHGGKESSKV